MAHWPALFEPLQVGRKLRLDNRLVMAPMTTTAGEVDGSFSDQEIAYLARRGRSGIGLVMTPACYCHKSGHSFERQVGCDRDELRGSLARCAESINRTGAASFLQIHHGGNAARQQLCGAQPVAPSAVHNRRGTSELPRALTGAEIENLIESFAGAAARAKAAGFSGIELHGANTYLFQQFFSPFTNKRDDEWGAGTWVNRVRFASEVVKAVRQAVGDEYPVSFRVSPEEPDPDGYSTYDAIKLLKALVPLGVDIVHVSSWDYGVGVRGDYPNHTHPTKLIRESLPAEVPVIGVGGIQRPEQAQRVLDDGIDMVAIGRGLLLDADWAAKVRDGREGSIRKSASTTEEVYGLDIPVLMKPYAARFFVTT
ncbi:MAG: tRNA-dihydrouridine synthase [candidate division Zixibacteria bacterium]|nr:tRNA-dihydrouridine synthase [candidate division Zixibacteria bacterium]